MTTPTVADVMTRAVAMAGTMTSLEEIVAVLDRLGIDSVPIVDEVGRPLGSVASSMLNAARLEIATIRSAACPASGMSNP